MSITTIKLEQKTKFALDRFKEKTQSYDKTILKLISLVERKNLLQKLEEGYKQMGKEDLQILNEWENASSHVS